MISDKLYNNEPNIFNRFRCTINFDIKLLQQQLKIFFLRGKMVEKAGEFFYGLRYKSSGHSL